PPGPNDRGRRREIREARRRPDALGPARVPRAQPARAGLLAAGRRAGEPLESDLDREIGRAAVPDEATQQTQVGTGLGQKPRLDGVHPQAADLPKAPLEDLALLAVGLLDLVLVLVLVLGVFFDAVHRGLTHRPYGAGCDPIKGDLNERGCAATGASAEILGTCRSSCL